MANHTKSVQFIGRNDYEVTVDGGIIGFTSSMIAGIELADVHIIDLVQHESRAVVDSEDTTALMELESTAGCNYFETLDSAADAPKPIWIHTTTEAAFAVACIKRRKQSRRAA